MTTRNTWLAGLALTLSFGSCFLMGCGDDGGGDGVTGGGTAQGGSGGEGGGTSQGGSSTGQGGSVSDGGGGQGGMGGSAPMGDWTCLGTFETPSYEAGEVTGDMNVSEIVDGTPLADLDVQTCAVDDPDCASPLGSATTNASGSVSLTVTTADPVYFEMTGDGIPTTIAIPSAPYGDNFVDSWTIIDSANLVFFISLATLGQDADPTRGHVGVRIADCVKAYGPGVEFELDTADGDTSLAYFNETGTPNPSLTATTGFGGAGFANVPVGPAVLTAKVAATGEVITTRDIFVRADAVTLPQTLSPVPQAE
jgi:hypothetical protein